MLRYSKSLQSCYFICRMKMFSIFSNRIFSGRLNVGLAFISSEKRLTVRMNVLNRRSTVHSQDCHWTNHLLHPAAAGVRDWICYVQEKVGKHDAYLLSWCFKPYSQPDLTCACFFSFSQTQGPSGPIYASSNPEYLSANDGEKKKDLTICSVFVH